MSRLRPLLIAGLSSLATSLAAPAAAASLEATVVHVDDGDTIDVRIGPRTERVRYIGVDAPEIAHEARDGRPFHAGTPGGAAAAHVNATLVAGRAVKLELDVEPRDRYGRLLAYVWVGNTMINAELVARGYARAMPIAPNLRYASRFAALESQARTEGLGLWGEPRSGIELVSHVRARLPEARRARVVAVRQHRHPARPLRAQPAPRLDEQRSRHATTAPVR